LELLATYATEKSLLMNENTRQPNAKAISRACACAAGRDTAIHAAFPFAAP